jgi:hypothetical protein
MDIPRPLPWQMLPPVFDFPFSETAVTICYFSGKDIPGHFFQIEAETVRQDEKDFVPRSAACCYEAE